MIISFISQKGGVGRSTLARATAVELARSGKNTHLVDLDSRQQTSAKWAERRDTAGIHPAIETGVYRRHDVALKAASNYQCLIVDTRPFVDISSLDIARQSNLVVIATGTSLDDLEPSLPGSLPAPVHFSPSNPATASHWMQAAPLPKHSGKRSIAAPETLSTKSVPEQRAPRFDCFA